MWEEDSCVEGVGKELVCGGCWCRRFGEQGADEVGVGWQAMMEALDVG
jgi:hypothetical protein